MLETILAIIGGALALLFGSGWARSSWQRRQVENELSERRLASTKQQEAAMQAAIKTKDDQARQKPIDTNNRSDFQ
jgi:uncharacterized membrane protein